MGNIVLASIPPLFTTAVFTSFGFSVFFTQNKTRLKIVFGLLCVSTSLWQWSWFVLFNTTDIHIAKEIAITGHLAILTLPAILYNLAYRINEKHRPLEQALVYFSWFVVCALEVVLVTTNHIIDGVHTFSWGYYPKAGDFYWVFMLFMAITMTATVITLLRDYKNAISYFRKEQIRYMLIGLVFYNMSTVDSLTSYGVKLYPLGFVFLLFFLGCVWLAVTQHHFLKISDTLKKTLLLSLLCVYTWMAFTFMNTVFPTFKVSLYVAPLYVELFFIFMFVLIATSIAEYFNSRMTKAMEKYVNPVRVVRGILGELKEAHSLPKAGQVIGENLEHVMDASISINLRTADEKTIEIYRSVLSHNTEQHFTPDSLSKSTLDFIKRSKEAFTATDLRFSPLPDGQQAEIARELEVRKIAAIMPLRTDTERLGYILFSIKNDNSHHTPRDREIMKILLPTISEEIKRLSD